MAEDAKSHHENSELEEGVDWDSQVEFLRGLAAIVRDEELSELSVEQDGVRLSLRSRRPSMVPPEPLAAPAVALPVALGSGLAAGVAEEEEALPAETAREEVVGTPIVSPMVGVFYRSKTPEDPPFTDIGERVEVGQIIGLVEAMKTFNEITSEVEGEVIAMPATNGSLVETGAPLVVVKA
jgi:acetyl-CoA carboxylase biotin carboxyl carrier protein